MFDLNTVDLILAGVGSLTVLGVTEIVKRFLKAKGAGAIAVSLAVSAGFTAYYLIAQHLFSIVPFVGYTLLVFAVANGFFKATHTPTT